jgi:hypothetical protein
MSSLLDNVRTGISKLKRATEAEPIHFTLLAGNDGPKFILLLGPDATNKSLLDEATKEIGAKGKPVTGTCFVHDGNTVIFSGITGASLAAAKKALKVGGSSMDADSHVGEAPEEEDAEAPPPEAKAPAPKPDPRIAEITNEVKSLTARLAKADPKASSAVGAKLKISQAGAAYRGGNLDQAKKLLKEADDLLTFLASKK